MTPLEIVCPNCKAAPGAACTIKVRDGHRNVVAYCPERIAAAPAEPTFTLRAQDQSAAGLIQLWMSLNNKAPKEKLESAQRTLELFRAWPRKKQAD